jgi:hypothetical protein
MEQPIPPIIFTPDNEPYLGRTLLFHFDQLISSCLEQNAIIAPMSHRINLSDRQEMAALLIPQAISISLSIRELIQQGYLFGARVLFRPLVERITILQYVCLYPASIEIWKRGWNYDEAPSLSKMFDAIQAKNDSSPGIRGYKLTSAMNAIMHGRPESARWNIISLEEGYLGYATSKILNRPDLCDEICADVILWLVIVQAMMGKYFPLEN